MIIPLVSGSIYCWAWNRIYIKANGRIPCWCDKGESHTIIKEDFITKDFIIDIVNSEQMRQMRIDILGLNRNFIKECDGCCCLMKENEKQNVRYEDSEYAINVGQQSESALNILKNTAKRRNWPIGSIDKISEIQLEPSFPCNLRCPACIHGKHKNSLSTEDPPYLFPLTWFKHMIDSASKHNVEVSRIQYCGKGEPTLNKDLPQMIKYARDKNIKQSMDTNATHPFKSEYLLLNKINCSIDGSEEKAYLTYRRNGNFNKAIGFLYEAARAKKDSGLDCRICWKYILFNTTEADDMLNKAQEIASDAGIDELNFVITPCGAHDRSVRATDEKRHMLTMKQYIETNKIFHNTIVTRS